MKKIILCVVAFNLAALPCFADIIPARYDDNVSKETKTAVSDRLQELGASRTAAETHVRTMTSDDLAYFATDTNRIQAAGGLYWYEWILGAAVFVGTIGGVYLIAEEHSDNKEAGP